MQQGEDWIACEKLVSSIEPKPMQEINKCHQFNFYLFEEIILINPSSIGNDFYHSNIPVAVM